MAEETSFEELIRRVRSGDETAAAELVKRYEPAIRRAVRIRLVDSRLRRVLDSMDICQSVLASFFVRAALGQYELDRAEQLMGLLVRMAQNKVAGQARRQRAGRRDIGRVEPGEGRECEVIGPGESPSQHVALNELLHLFRERLSPEEWHLADQRAQGREWGDLAAELGESPEALRKRLARAVDRVAHQLHLDESDHE